MFGYSGCRVRNERRYRDLELVAEQHLACCSVRGTLITAGGASASGMPPAGGTVDYLCGEFLRYDMGVVAVSLALARAGLLYRIHTDAICEK
jgi:hypothetical protein